MVRDDSKSKATAEENRNCIYGLICAVVVIGIIAIAAAVVAAIAMFSPDSTDREDTRHVFCVDVHDRAAGDLSSAVLGKVVVNTRNNSLCINIAWFRDESDCATLDEIAVRGPVNSVDGLDSSFVLGTPFTINSNATNGTLIACTHLTPSQQRTLLSNPAHSYIEAIFGGGGCSANVYRDYFRSLCADADFSVRHDVDDDDTDVEFSSSSEYDPYVSSSELSDTSDSSELSTTDMARRAHRAPAHHAPARATSKSHHASLAGGATAARHAKNAAAAAKGHGRQ